MNIAPDAERASSAGPPIVYSVPRRLDLTMLLCITLAYALLFTVMRILRSDAVTFALTAGFFTAVGIGQAVLFGGKSPRLASVVVGGLYFFLLRLVADGDWGAHSVILGGFCGYFAGLLDAGVFLVLDLVRTRVKRASRPDDLSEQHCEL